MRLRDRTVALVAAWLVVAAASGIPPGAGAAEHAHGSHGRAHAATGVLSLDVYASAAELHLLLGRSDEAGKRTLWYQHSRDGGLSWSRPVRVDAGSPAAQTFRRGNDAQIAFSSGTLTAVWTGQGTGWGGTGPLVTAISRDGGASWRRGAAPADGAATATQSFIELTADAAGFRLAWIDSRDEVPGLRYASSADPGRAWSANATVAAQTCDCCWNSLVTAGADLLLLYRGHSPRDMALASSRTGAAWRRIGPVGAFNWQIDACPETGGALAVTRSRTLHALAWTGSERALGLYHLRSADSGAAWSKPQRLGGMDARHADLAAGSDGSLFAVWDDAADHVIRAAISRDDGSTWSSPRAVSTAAAQASHPRAVAVGGGYRVFWTEMARSGAILDWKTELVTLR